MPAANSKLIAVPSSAQPSILRTFHIAQRWSSSKGGGSERVVDELAGSLPEAGAAFTGFVTGPRDLQQTSHDLFRSFAPEDASTFERMKGARQIIGQAICKESPDIVASHFALYAFPALSSLRLVPHVVHFHGPWAAESLQEGGRPVAARFKQALEGRVYRSAQRIIVLSHAFRNVIVEDYGVNPDLVRIIPGSVDIQRFAVPQSRAQAREILGWPQDRPILISVRRLVSRMGLDGLIRALSEVRQHVPEVLLHIGGTGRLRQQLEEQVAQAGLQNNVRFLGFIPDEELALAYRAADINVVPTIALEGFGLVAAEAMAAGTPSMVTPVGGLPEIVSGLNSDLIFPSTSVADIAFQLSAALTGSIRLPGEEECRRYTELNFNSAIMARRTVQVYQELHA